MTIRDFQTSMGPILAFLADGQPRSTKDAIVAMSDLFGLSDEERAAMLPSGRLRTTDNRVNWSLTHLSRAGLLDRPARGQVKITAAGRDVLDAHPDRVDIRVLREFPAYRQFREGTRAIKPIASPGRPVEVVEEQVSPQDLLDAAVAENRAAVEGDLLSEPLPSTSRASSCSSSGCFRRRAMAARG